RATAPGPPPPAPPRAPRPPPRTPRPVGAPAEHGAASHERPVAGIADDQTRPTAPAEAAREVFPLLGNDVRVEIDPHQRELTAGLQSSLHRRSPPPGRGGAPALATTGGPPGGGSIPRPPGRWTDAGNSGDRSEGGPMKISAFHLMPHRELPPDFEQRYESVWVTPPWWELADARRVGQYYNWTLDELLYAARAGFDGLCTNEHHQNPSAFIPSPNLMGGALAKLTNGMDVAIVQMGATLPTSNPPIRVAEEYAMLDCISGGRLVAGLPLGSPMDVNLCYGITPMEHRERYREAFALTLKAWQAREIFPWNGRYYQLANVNLWPRPIQQPHPPV